LSDDFVARHQLTPLVVRVDPELERVRASLDAARHGSGRVVSITGEAGSGKSHLVRAAVADVGQRGTATLVGRYFGQYTGVAFHPFAEIAAALERRHPGVRRQWPELRYLAPRRRAPRHALSSLDAQLRVFRTLLDRLERLAPLVILVEDVHGRTAPASRSCSISDVTSPAYPSA
jgi:predicted ATPase